MLTVALNGMWCYLNEKQRNPENNFPSTMSLDRQLGGGGERKKVLNKMLIYRINVI